LALDDFGGHAWMPATSAGMTVEIGATFNINRSRPKKALNQPTRSYR